MFKFKVFFLSVIFICLQMSISDAMAERLVACGFDCTSAHAKAMQEGTIMNPGERFSVIDTKNFSVKSYEVRQVGSSFEPAFAAVNITTSNFALATANEIKSKVNDIESYDVFIPGSLPNQPNTGDMTSAIRMMASNNQRAVADYIKDNLDWDTELGALAGTLLTAFGKLTDVKIVVTVKFEDGSTAVFESSGIDSSGKVQWKYQEDSAFTADGVAIPSSSVDVLDEPWPMNEYQLTGGLTQISDVFDWITRNAAQCKQTSYTICRTTKEGVECTRYFQCR